MSEAKLEFLDRSRAFWNPGKTQDWQDMGVDLVIDRRETPSKDARSCPSSRPTTGTRVWR